MQPILPATSSPKTMSALKKIFVLLRAQNGHDSSQYKSATIERRMAAHPTKTMDVYIRFIQQSPKEVEVLYCDMLNRETTSCASCALPPPAQKSST